MAGPWEKYGTATPAAPTGPWSKYTPPAEDEQKMPTWRDMPLPGMPILNAGEAVTALGNVPNSAADLVGNTVTAVAHPIDTAKALYELGPSGIAKFYVDRYGSPEAGKKAFIEDPVGVLADFSGFASGVGLGARIPGTAGRIAATAGKVGAVTDPLVGLAKGAAYAGKKLAKGAEGASTAIAGGFSGVGQESVRAAAQAGYEGGAASDALTGNMRKKTPGNEAVEHAKHAFLNIIQKRSLEYAGDMKPIYKDRRILSKVDPKTGAIVFPKVDKALAKARRETQHVPPFPGKPGVTFLPSEAKVVDDMSKIVDEWKQRGPAYHTMGGFNDMKRQIGEYVIKYDKGTVERRAADKVYNSIKKSIIDINPKYEKVMKAYDDASDMVRELEKTFRLGDAATQDSALRSLQATLRDTAHTNYGVRRNLMNVLRDNGAEHLVKELAGQTMRAAVRPGLGIQMAGSAVVSAVAGGVLPWQTIATLAAFSPRLTGEVAHGIGVAGRMGNKAIVKPILAADRFLRKHGVKLDDVAKATGKVGFQAGRLEGANEKKTALKKALSTQAKLNGMNIRDNVLSSVVDDLMSEDPEAYIKGIGRISKNTRLLKLITAAGEKE